MYQERKKLGLEVLVSKLLSNFWRLILVNLLFAIPFVLSLVVASVIYVYILKISFIFSIPFALVLASPFYPGVVVLARDYSKGIKDIKIFSTYTKAIKENALRFLWWGVVMHWAIVGCYFGFKIYSSMASYFGWIFYVVMFLLVIIDI